MYTNYSLTTIRFFWAKNKILFKPGPNPPFCKVTDVQFKHNQRRPSEDILMETAMGCFVLLGADIKGESAGNGQAASSPPLRLHNRRAASLFHNIPRATKIKNRAAH